MKKKIMFTLLVSVLVFGAATCLKARAGIGDNTSGWLWGGSEDANIVGGIMGSIDGNETGAGKISMNSIDCDVNGNGFSDVYPAVNPDCPAFGSAYANYGVNVPESGGTVTGYAWSGNMGYIDFEPQVHCGSAYLAASCLNPEDGGPGGVNYDSATGNLTGWARFTGIAAESASGNSGNWEGWIKMAGVKLVGGVFSGYGWNGETVGTGANGAEGLGWIDFSKASLLPSNLKICINSCDSGMLIAKNSSRTMAVGNSLNLKACFNASANCDTATGDITASAIWNENNIPDNAVSWSGANPKTLTANNLGTEGVSASYNSQTSGFAVTVVPLCVCDTGCEADFCSGVDCRDNCGNLVCPGTKNCDANWKEVTP